MDSRESTSTTSKENLIDKNLTANDKCDYALFSCESLIKTMGLPSNLSETDVIYHSFIENIKKLTARLWRNIVGKKEFEDLLNQKGACFKIMVQNSTCQSLNQQYIPLLENLSLYQKKIIKSSNFEEKNSYLIIALNTLENFLEPTLNLFKTDIKSLKLMVRTEIDGIRKTKVENLENEVNNINETIRNYLNELYSIIRNLKPQGLAPEEKNKKDKILGQIDDSYQKIGTFLGIPIDKEATIASLYEKNNTISGSTSKNNGGSTSEVNDLAILKNNKSKEQTESSEQTVKKEAIKQQKKDNFDTKGSSTNEYTTDTGLSSDNNPQLVFKKKLARNSASAYFVSDNELNSFNTTGTYIHNLTTTSPEANSNMIKSSSISPILVGLLIAFSSIGLGSLAAYFLIKKIKRNKKTPKENEGTQLEEVVLVDGLKK